MSVYFVTCRELGLVKIGHATSPTKRLQGFKTGSPADIELEATLPGAAAEERELHSRFAEHGHRGEWFRLCPEIEALIEELRPKPPVPEYTGFQQGELVGPFRFDPEGWLAEYAGTDEPMLKGVADWLKYKESQSASEAAPMPPAREWPLGRCATPTLSPMET